MSKDFMSPCGPLIKIFSGLDLQLSQCQHGLETICGSVTFMEGHQYGHTKFKIIGKRLEILILILIDIHFYFYRRFTFKAVSWFSTDNISRRMIARIDSQLTKKTTEIS